VTCTANYKKKVMLATTYIVHAQYKVSLELIYVMNNLDMTH